MELSSADLPNEKFRFTGTLPAKTVARLATSPPIPGGMTIPTLEAEVNVFIRSDSREAKTRRLPALISLGSFPA